MLNEMSVGTDDLWTVINRRWIGSAAVLLVLFVFVLGRGLTWHR
jgi:hypothetical protein